MSELILLARIRDERTPAGVVESGTPAGFADRPNHALCPIASFVSTLSEFDPIEGVILQRVDARSCDRGGISTRRSPQMAKPT